MPITDYDAQIAAYAKKLQDPLWVYYHTYQLFDGGRHYMMPFPGFGSLTPQSAAPAPAAPLPPYAQISFDTIGQTIARSIGHCRLALHPIWARGIAESGDTAISNTQTFAAAICAPIDPLETGEIFGVWDGGIQVQNEGGVIAPIGWTTDDVALLTASLAGMTIYPGDEAQLPDPLIVADKGADKTNAFRGIRYIVLPDYPINGRGGGSGLPQLSVGFKRTNDGEEPEEDTGAVEFLDGSA